MTSFQNVRRLAVAALLGVGVACGGGGDSGLSLTAKNAESLASQAMNSSDMLLGMSDIFEGFDEVLETQNALTVLCVAGDFTQTINDVGPMNEVSTGDSVAFMFNDCTMSDDGLDITFDGGISLTVEEVSGTEGDAFTHRVRFRFDSLTVTIDDIVMEINGAFTAETSSTDGSDLRSMVSGTNFSMFATVINRSENMRLADFMLDRQVDAAGDYSFSYDARVSGSVIGGTVWFETLTPFTGNGDSDPSAGSLEIRGEEGGTATLNAIDDELVEILIDTDGDGSPEATINTTWDYLQDEEPGGSEL